MRCNQINVVTRLIVESASIVINEVKVLDEQLAKQIEMCKLWFDVHVKADEKKKTVGPKGFAKRFVVVPIRVCLFSYFVLRLALR